VFCGDDWELFLVALLSLTLPWIQGPAGTVAFAGEVVEDYLFGHGGGCYCSV
jgi:hypothetical protein